MPSALPRAAGAEPREIVVGSKVFPESIVLGELAAQVIRAAGVPVTHKRGLGSTAFLWNALRSGDIHIYPEYTGTITQEILAGRRLRDDEALRAALAERGIAMSRPLGFNNTYAIGMKEEVAERLGIRKMSDLRDHPELRFGITNEVKARADGWPMWKERYQLPQEDVVGMEHALAYVALESGKIDATDLYSTDPEILYYGLRVLEDDLHIFPQYYAVFLYRSDLHEDVVNALMQLEGRIPRIAIVDMNARVKPKPGEARPVPESRVAAEFLAYNPFFHKGEQNAETTALAEEGLVQRLLVLTRQHLLLVAISLTAAILVAVPLGIVAAKFPRLGQTILGGTGIIQTIPSLALLVFLIPVFQIGAKPAIVALFLYSLLPIVRNTYAGLHDVPLHIRESAEALGLPPLARLRLVELPMAARSILAGIKTAAVINVGTATLGGLIGAGGYGDRIMTGVRQADNAIILEGAIPAAILALVVQGLFEIAERWLVPKGLRL
jgi:osmoprotectant transport system permease protein